MPTSAALCTFSLIEKPMSEATYRSNTRTTSDRSFSYHQRRRAEKIYALDGLTPVDTAVLLALNYHSKVDGGDMRPSSKRLAVLTNLSPRSVVRSLSRLV